MPQRAGSSSGANFRAHAFIACSTARACLRSESVFVNSCNKARASSRVFIAARVYPTETKGPEPAPKLHCWASAEATAIRATAIARSSSFFVGRSELQRQRHLKKNLPCARPVEACENFHE